MAFDSGTALLDAVLRPMYQKPYARPAAHPAEEEDGAATYRRQRIIIVITTTNIIVVVGRVIVSCCEINGKDFKKSSREKKAESIKEKKYVDKVQSSGISWECHCCRYG